MLPSKIEQLRLTVEQLSHRLAIVLTHSIAVFLTVKNTLQERMKHALTVVRIKLKRELNVNLIRHKEGEPDINPPSARMIGWFLLSRTNTHK